MARLEDLTTGTLVKGIVPDDTAELVSVKWHGSDVLEVVYKDSTGRVGTEILFRDREPSLQTLTAGHPWSLDGDGKLFRLVSEAHRIRLAHLVDPLLAVHTSLVEPLPHQILAVYEAMLPRQPLRFLLADDPGAGKTKMSATFFGGEVKYTKRYHLGRLLGGLTRHFVLMTATPHNGKEEDFNHADRLNSEGRRGTVGFALTSLQRRLASLPEAKSLVNFSMRRAALAYHSA